MKKRRSKIKTAFEGNIGKGYKKEFEEIKKAKFSFRDIKPVTPYSSMSICLVAIACSIFVLITDLINHNTSSAILFGIITAIMFVLLFLLCIKDKDELLAEMKKQREPANNKTEAKNNILFDNNAYSEDILDNKIDTSIDSKTDIDETLS